jgi:hypothetical protein
MKTRLILAASTLAILAFSVQNRWRAASQASVSMQGEQLRIHGKRTYAGRTWQGHRIEGLRINSRRVQGIFDDLNPETSG